MPQKNLTLAKLQDAALGAFFRPRDVEPFGISFPILQRLLKQGEIQKVGHGLYRLTSAEPDERETIAMVVSAVPNGIICLLSALRLHGIGTQMPHEVWIAIDRKARKPNRPPAQLRVFRFSGVLLTYGIQAISIQGVSVRVTSPARTIIDCFRYRRKLGMDVALEALREAVRGRKVSTEEVVRAAETCRVRTVMQPYLEALSL